MGVVDAPGVGCRLLVGTPVAGPPVVGAGLLADPGLLGEGDQLGLGVVEGLLGGPAVVVGRGLDQGCPVVGGSWVSALGLGTAIGVPSAGDFGSGSRPVNRPKK